MKSLTLEITTFCNEKCIHCYHSEYEKRVNLTDLVLLEKLLGEFAEKGFMSLVISGGEPLLNPKFREICALARKFRYLVSVKTNGLLIDDDTVRFLHDFKPKNVSVSIYSADPDEHDSVTQVAGSFEKSFNALKLLSENGIRAVASTPILKGIEHWRELPEMLDPFGIKWLCGYLVLSSFDSRDNVENLKNDEKFYMDFLKFARKYSEQFEKFAKKREICCCGGAERFAVIGADFSFRPCVPFLGSFGIYDGTNLEILLKKGRDAVESRFEATECRTCKLAEYCRICVGQMFYSGEKLLCSPSRKSFAGACEKFFNSLS